MRYQTKGNFSILLHLAVLSAVLHTTICFGQVSFGYDAYTNWQDWARLKSTANAGLASSYDRSGGNDDFSYYEDPNGPRTENEIVTAKTIQGPGVIYRFWMPHYTANRNFIVRMYFDGELTPGINTNSVELLGGSFNYFSHPLADTCAGGQVCYEPIPFRTSVKIETENKALPPDWHPDRHYYQYSFLTLPHGTDINTYTGTLTSQQQTARDAVVSLFNNTGVHPADSSQSAIDINTPTTIIDANSNITLADLTGPGLIRKVNIKMTDANDAELDGLRLKVFYDGNSNPAIDVSVGNFFGAGKQRVLYKSIPMGTDSNDGFYCYWPMPFREAVLVQLANTTDANIPITSAIVQYEPNTEVRKMCYLYAAENSAVKQAGQIYHQMFSATGCGHYVGNLLYVEQDSYSFSMLEGDEVITVDGNNILNGTGLEDAYNGGYYYNWVAVIPSEPEGGYPQSAFRALNGILYVHRQEGIEYARADQYRWQIADCVPFSKSIDVKIENRYGITGGRWTSVAFWYQYHHCADADFDNDCDVDFFDYAAFASHWLDDCQSPDFCDGADLDTNEKVDTNDLSIFTEEWL